MHYSTNFLIGIFEQCKPRISNPVHNEFVAVDAGALKVSVRVGANRIRPTEVFVFGAFVNVRTLLSVSAACIAGVACALK